MLVKVALFQTPPMAKLQNKSTDSPSKPHSWSCILMLIWQGSTLASKVLKYIRLAVVACEDLLAWNLSQTHLLPHLHLPS